MNVLGDPYTQEIVVDEMPGKYLDLLVKKDKRIKYLTTQVRNLKRQLTEKYPNKENVGWVNKLKAETVSCRKCFGNGQVEIQSGPYMRECPECNGTGKQTKQVTKP